MALAPRLIATLLLWVVAISLVIASLWLIDLPSGATVNTAAATPDGSPPASPIASPVASPQPGDIVRLFNVEVISVEVSPARPARVEVIIEGYLPDACTRLGAPQQTRDGSVVTITVPTYRSPDAVCAAAIVEVDITVVLEGDFATGTYTVAVNDRETTFIVP